MEVPSQPLSRRGRTLRIARLVITLSDGTEETWDFPPEQYGYYRESTGRSTKPVGKWKTHEIWWQSDRLGPPPSTPVVAPGEPILDKRGRATGFKA